MRKLNKKTKVAVTGATLVAAVGGGLAFAYWSTTGDGSGTSTTTAGASQLTIAQTGAPTNLAPGVPAGGISGTVTNNAVNNAFVHTVTVSIATVTASGSCDASDYTLSNPVVTVEHDFTPGQTQSFSGPSLGFNNKASNQDGCKGATVNLAYASN